jgi:hypothetical protein
MDGAVRVVPLIRSLHYNNVSTDSMDGAVRVVSLIRSLHHNYVSTD